MAERATAPRMCRRDRRPARTPGPTTTSATWRRGVSAPSATCAP